MKTRVHQRASTVVNAVAEKGSIGHAVTLRDLLADAISREASYADRVWSLVREFEESSAWTQLLDRNGAPFDSLKSCVEHPRPEGFGITYSRLKHIEASHREWLAKTAAVVEPMGEHGHGPGRGHKRADDVRSLKDSSGNKAETIVRRIKKKAAGGDERATRVLADLKEGKYASARAAGLDAGVVKPADPVRQMHNAITKALPAKPEQLERNIRDVVAPAAAALKSLTGQRRIALAYELIRIAEEALR